MKLSTRQIAVSGLLGALTVVLGLAPVGGFIPVPTPAGAATTMHLPTILAGVLEGPVTGALVGFIFGLFSFLRAPASVNPVARLMFTDPLIAFIPRIAIGVTSFYAYRLMRRPGARPVLAACTGLLLAHAGHSVLSRPGLLAAGAAWVPAAGLGLGAAVAILRLAGRAQGAPALAALAGTLTNTVGVLGLAVLRGYLPGGVALTVGVVHGVPEILVAMAIVATLHGVLARAYKPAAAA